MWNEVSTEKSKIMTNSTNDICVDISMNIQTLKMINVKYLRAELSKMAQLSRNLHQDCLSNGSGGQISQDLVRQHHQLHNQI